MGRGAPVVADDWGSAAAFSDAFMVVLKESAPWVAFYTAAFFLSREIGPAMFSHCAKLSPDQVDYWAASVASCINCFIIVPMAWNACADLGLLNADASFTTTSPLSTMCCYAMVGYTAYDLMPLLYHRKKWGGVGMYLVHHICTLLSWGVAASTGYAHSVAVPVLLLEITGPFTNMRWFLHTAGLKDTTLYLVNGVCMTISFFMLRVVFNWWLFITRFVLQREAFLMQPIWIRYFYYFLFPTNLALQLLWFKKIIDGVLKLLGVGAGDAKAKKKK